jgi:hypothetical protein
MAISSWWLDFAAMLHPVPFFRPFRIIEPLQSPNQIPRNPPCPLKTHPGPNHFVAVTDMVSRLLLHGGDGFGLRGLDAIKAAHSHRSTSGRVCPELFILASAVFSPLISSFPLSLWGLLI